MRRLSTADGLTQGIEVTTSASTSDPLSPIAGSAAISPVSKRHIRLRASVRKRWNTHIQPANGGQSLPKGGPMAQVSQVASWRPNPHKLDAFIGQVAKAKAIHERLGAAVNVAQTQVGGDAMTIVYMLTFESGATYGAFIDALSDDSEWQSFWAEAVASASAELVSTGLYTAIEGI